MEPLSCPFCSSPISANFFFCPNCGKEIKKAPPSITIVKQIVIYALSILLPPLGLFPGIKYLLQKDEKAKIIGAAAIILTIASSVITVWISLNLFNQLNKTIVNQVRQYQQSNF